MMREENPRAANSSATARLSTAFTRASNFVVPTVTKTLLPAIIAAGAKLFLRRSAAHFGDLALFNRLCLGALHFLPADRDHRQPCTQTATSKPPNLLNPMILMGGAGIRCDGGCVSDLLGS